MIVRRATFDDCVRLATLRHALWPHHAPMDHQIELETLLASATGKTVVFVADLVAGGIVGFAEASIRHDYVNGCHSSPVAYLEGSMWPRTLGAQVSPAPWWRLSRPGARRLAAGNWPRTQP
jgi:hypothetical protein